MYSLIQHSQASKLGGMPASYSPISDCNPDCPLMSGGCFALHGHVAIHWLKVSIWERGVSFWQFCRQVKALPRGIVWRHNIAGDLPRTGRTKRICKFRATKLMKANKGKKGYTYTHHEQTPHNLAIIREMNEGGFTVNVSCDTPQQAADIRNSTALPTVTILPSDAPKVQEIDGVKIVACPSQTSDKVHCNPVCVHQMCANPKRDYVVGFYPHGSGKKRADVIARSA